MTVEVPWNRTRAGSAALASYNISKRDPSYTEMVAEDLFGCRTGYLAYGTDPDRGRTAAVAADFGIGEPVYEIHSSPPSQDALDIMSRVEGIPAVHIEIVDASGHLAASFRKTQEVIRQNRKPLPSKHREAWYRLRKDPQCSIDKYTHWLEGTSWTDAATHSDLAGVGGYKLRSWVDADGDHCVISLPSGETESYDG